ncbi:PAS domain-containing protein [Oceanobacillus alkalisoli]|uniref:PAS domain-containing protein n=1 Tax=Oceanobacillus alkalisoli TaxID=2925113 RepID=UPI001EEFD0B9|nr:PAS domain-containing protein [Oceanobacillus alkalisoli]MCF3943701.1 PAS domain-containing protein [Oceanobacillus alkalisoli]MCG5104112.1 PAS domain-containing protein [Oceanobacillus alkalisoli]
MKEADIILNNLPLEITFVDKNDIFKYFNEKVEAADMMFVRTPSSIGRNVANCHPPKSLKKVMQLIRDLKTKKRTSETMWFKKEGNVIHITYKGVFDENGEYVGILEYVQDIQPFLDLPREVKKEVSKLEKVF